MPLPELCSLYPNIVCQQSLYNSTHANWVLTWHIFAHICLHTKVWFCKMTVKHLVSFYLFASHTVSYLVPSGRVRQTSIVKSNFYTSERKELFYLMNDCSRLDSSASPDKSGEDLNEVTRYVCQLIYSQNVVQLQKKT